MHNKLKKKWGEILVYTQSHMVIFQDFLLPVTYHICPDCSTSHSQTQFTGKISSFEGRLLPRICHIYFTTITYLLTVTAHSMHTCTHTWYLAVTTSDIQKTFWQYHILSEFFVGGGGGGRVLNKSMFY